jgi:2-desacetyl-2-hydroxyethyl bacteriochlorophyllide A dehydrogenase
MKAALLYGPHDFRIEDIPDPVIKDDEYLVNVKVCGVCHSEIPQWSQKLKGLKYPRFIGHEVSGEILQAGKDVKKYKPGQRVALWVDGKGYAEKIAVKEDRIFPLDDSISYELALAEPIACTTNGVIRADVQLADTIALVGTGFMGLILLQELKLRGAKKIIAIDIRDEMLKLAEELGADITINPAKQKPLKVVHELTNKKGVDVSFEVGGVQSTLDIAAEICRMEGKLVIFGYHPGRRHIKNLGYWNWMAFNIVNAHFRDMGTILKGTKVGMDLLNAGKINMNPLVTHRYPIEKIEEAFLTSKEKPAGFVKSVIVMN